MNEINNNNQVNGAYDPSAAPQQPAYAEPQQPAYVQPQQPVYEQPQQPVYSQPYDPYAQQGYNQQAYQQPYQPYAQAEPVNDIATLVFGIIALVLSCTFYFSIGGIIFGAIAKSKANTLSQQNTNVGGTVTAGKITGTIGFVLGIVLTAILSIVIIAAL